MISLSPQELALLAINGFGAMQKQDELCSLIRKVLHLWPKNMLEIGSGKGGTTWAWSKLTSLLEICTVDLPNGPWGGGPSEDSIEYIRNESFPNFTFIAADSHLQETRKRVSTVFYKNTIDFLFIDGDHSYEGVKKDYENYSPLVRPGGLIAFHDICEHSKESGCEVKKFWDEVKVGKQYEEYISEPTNWGGIGLIVKE
jgi:hypothetical protein